MANTDAFYYQFRSTLLLAFFSGTYIPGISAIIPKIMSPTRYLFPSVVLMLSFVTFDLGIKTALDYNKLDFIIFVLKLSGAATYFWATTSMVHMLLRRKDMTDLIKIWSCDFQPRLWPDLRQSALKIQKQKAWNKIFKSMLFYTFPVCVGLIVAASRGSTIFADFSDGDDGTSWLLVMESLTFGAWIFWHTSLYGFFYTMMRMVLVELEYIEASFEKLFTTIKIQSDGSICSDEPVIGAKLSANDYSQLCHNAYQGLSKLLSYHVKILKFARKVGKIVGPLFFMELSILSAIVSIVVCGVSMKVYSADVVLIIVAANAYSCYWCFLMCWIGGEVNEKSSNFTNTAFYGNWFAYNVRTQKLLIPMIAMAHRPITVNPLGVLPMLPETFFAMVAFQYKFYRFMDEIVNL